MGCKNLWCYGSISPKTFLIFPKNFLISCFHPIEMQSIIHIRRYGGKSYAPVVLGDCDVTFIREGKDTGFYPSLYCIPII